MTGIPCLSRSAGIANVWLLCKLQRAVIWILRRESKFFQIKSLVSIHSACQKIIPSVEVADIHIQQSCDYPIICAQYSHWALVERYISLCTINCFPSWKSVGSWIRPLLPSFSTNLVWVEQPCNHNIALYDPTSDVHIRKFRVHCSLILVELLCPVLLHLLLVLKRMS